MRKIRIEVYTEDEDIANSALGMFIAGVLAQLMMLEGLTVESFQLSPQDLKELERLKNAKVH